MTKKQKKEHILTNLSFNHCIVSDALEEVCSREEFDQFLDSDKEFRDKVNELEDARNDKVRQVQMDLIMAGDSKQVSEYMKDLNKSTDGDTLGSIQRGTMLYIINSADNNSYAIDAFIKIFGCTKYRANQIFSDVLKENGIESPTARNKKKEENLEKSLFRRFERGELDKEEMYSELVKDALYMSQHAGREDVRINAGKLIMQYDEHLQNERDRKRREAESDDTALVDKLDAALSGVAPGEVAELKFRLEQGPLAIEEVEDVKS